MALTQNQVGVFTTPRCGVGEKFSVSIGMSSRTTLRVDSATVSVLMSGSQTNCEVPSRWQV
jgi:hypothetical protein